MDRQYLFTGFVICYRYDFLRSGRTGFRKASGATALGPPEERPDVTIDIKKTDSNYGPPLLCWEGQCLQTSKSGPVLEFNVSWAEGLINVLI